MDLRILIKLAEDMLIINGLTKQTVHTYKSTYNDILKFAEGRLFMESEETFRIFIDKYIKYINANITKTSTYFSRISAIRHLIESAHENGYVQNDFSMSIKNEQVRRVVLLPEELQAIFNYIDIILTKLSRGTNIREQMHLFKYLRARLLFSGLLWTGMKNNDLIQLTWTDINDLSKDMYTKNFYRADTIELFLSDAAWYHNNIEKIINDKMEWISSSNYLFPSKKDIGNYITIRSVQSTIKELVQEAGIEKKITPSIITDSYGVYNKKDNIRPMDI
ncbi:tyrosine-type recombinase/integrase [Vallitalea guaymasensis]|uniref:tyrosine-type recombinase/integrase n=1 Tax=Vallitalea guaymasensis TaxID=1185412 RepID=UPI00187D57ED|nr:tyrosine-type recombinase/integrase [Vallitalea guaymasensis]